MGRRSAIMDGDQGEERTLAFLLRYFIDLNRLCSKSSSEFYVSFENIRKNKCGVFFPRRSRASNEFVNSIATIPLSLGFLSAYFNLFYLDPRNPQRNEKESGESVESRTLEFVARFQTRISWKRRNEWQGRGEVNTRRDTLKGKNERRWKEGSEW